jgi:DNA recombination protein RmuC
LGRGCPGTDSGGIGAGKGACLRDPGESDRAAAAAATSRMLSFGCPRGSDVIVDAKVSLKAYERYHASTDDTVRSTAIKAHLISLRTHVKGLSEKHYEDLKGIRTLDFVLMFVPIEAAFFVALEHDRSLFAEAFEKNVILVSPSTLLVTLRTIHNIWRYADQNENALEIARQAGGLYDKFVGFIEALEDVGRQLDRARDAYRTARDRLSTGRGNLVRRAEQLKAPGRESQ